MQYQTIGGNPLPSSPPSWLPPFSPTLPRCLPWAPATALAALSTAPGGLCRPGRNQTRLSRTPGMDGAVGFVTVTRPHAFDGPSALLRSSGTLCRNSPCFGRQVHGRLLRSEGTFRRSGRFFSARWSRSRGFAHFRLHGHGSENTTRDAEPRRGSPHPHHTPAEHHERLTAICRRNLIASPIGYSAPHSIHSASGSPAESRRASPSQ